MATSRPISPPTISPASTRRRRRRRRDAFWDIVDASRAPEDAELADVIDALSIDEDASGEPVPPIAFTLAKVLEKATELAPKDDHGNPERNSFAAWLADRKTAARYPTASSNVAIRQCATTPPTMACGRSRASGKPSTRSPASRSATAWPPPLP